MKGIVSNFIRFFYRSVVDRRTARQRTARQRLWGAERLGLDVDEGNVAARRFYASLGFMLDADGTKRFGQPHKQILISKNICDF